MLSLIPRSFLAAAFGVITVSAEETAPAFADIRKIDAHAHTFEDLPELNAYMREMNIRTINICNRGTEGHVEIMHKIAADLYRKHPELYPFLSTFDLLRRDEASYTSDVIKALDETFAQGAVGVKIWKEIGLRIKDRNGRFILADDPLFDPIYAHIAKRGKVLMAHLAEPIDAWRPLDPKSLLYASYSKSKQWYFYDKPEYPTHAAITGALDNVLRKHPTLIVVGAHLGSQEHDLEAIAERLDKYPNYYVEVSGRTRFLARHPSDRVRGLFVKYPNRFLYGVDGIWKPYLDPTKRGSAQIKGHLNWRSLQYQADYNYYARSGEMTYAGQKVQSLNLPRSVLEKFYHENAERLFKLETAWTGGTKK